MKQNEFNTLGKTKQLEYINRLEEINKQKQKLIESLEKEKAVSCSACGKKYDSKDWPNSWRCRNCF
jgi:tRNA(Ile2) C34 agmatinyltransferase TiaS